MCGWARIGTALDSRARLIASSGESRGLAMYAGFPQARYRSKASADRFDVTAADHDCRDVGTSHRLAGGEFENLRFGDGQSQFGSGARRCERCVRIGPSLSSASRSWSGPGPGSRNKTTMCMAPCAHSSESSAPAMSSTPDRAASARASAIPDLGVVVGESDRLQPGRGRHPHDLVGRLRPIGSRRMNMEVDHGVRPDGLLVGQSS